MAHTIQLPSKPRYRKLELHGQFTELFLKIEARYNTAFLLESLGEQSYDSRYSVIGFAPLHFFEGRSGELIVDGVSRAVANPYQELRAYVPQDVIARHYAGGLVGYLGYDAVNFFEPALQLQWHPDFPAFEFGFYDDGIIHDKMTGETTYFFYNRDRFAEISDLNTADCPPLESLSVSGGQSSCSQAEYFARVQATMQEIIAGNTFQCQIGFLREYELSGHPFHIYKRLSEVNPSPHMYYLKAQGRVILGASPELLFRLRSGEMESFPLAGTIHRGKDAAEDLELARRLLNDPKEIAEHNMLIDLHRNDIGRVARFGTVKVRRFFDLKKFSHVQHISSEVVGIIDRRYDMFDGVQHSFPAGTLSGAPKIESIKIIEKIEQSPRGPYGGAIGHFGLNGDSTFAIPIRTLFISAERAFVRAAAGIVYDSRPQAEYNEVVNKMAALTRVLAEFQENKA
ncbi:MAG: anthranilate synthase component I family protein [Leptospiraceae bacterium]|nr:anthranilate synthase component I family protein [Leptospiraceae bacterium]